MKQQFTKEFIYANCGCYSSEKLNTCSFMKLEDITLKSILESEIPVKDKFWFVCKKLATKEENQQIAITLAEMVLPIYEKKYPESKAPREAIEAAKLFISGHISVETLLDKRRAAAAAAYAAYANDAAAAAYAAAAYAADDADAYAAYADDADAAYAAAAAAYAAYADDAIKDNIYNYLLSFVEENA